MRVARQKMALKPYSSSQKNTVPSKLFLLVVLAIGLSISLSISVIKLFHHTHPHYIRQTLSLPELSHEEEEELESENEPEAEKEEVSKKEGEWEVVTAQPGDSLATIFRRLGLSSQTLQNIVHGSPHAKLFKTIKANQHLQVLIQKNVLEKLIIPINATQSLTVSRDGTRYKTEINSRETSSQNHYVTATIRGSLYSTARRMNIPYKLIRQMTDIFHWQIDFAKEIRPGDQFTIVYKAFYIENKLVGTGEIIAVSYKNHGKTYEAIRYTNRNGDFDYYTSQGNSLRKAFTRYPLKFSHISSTFSLSRMHPILHRPRPHKGIDLAAPIGTPIHAIGDGRIEMIGRQSDYGNMVKIIHNNTYSSLYGHMLKFQKGLSKGDHIKRGQVIGYVGQTGLASGPHCHFEIHVKHQPKNPTTVNLPLAPSIPKRELASFKVNAATLLAQMKLYEEAQLAASRTKPKTTA